MQSIIWLFIIIMVFNAFSGFAKKQQQQKKSQGAPVDIPQPISPPLYEHPYSQSYNDPQTSQPVMQKQKIKPVNSPGQKYTEIKTKANKVEPESSASLEGVSLEGLPLDYSIHVEIGKEQPAFNVTKKDFTQSELIKGMVMSEILAKPKALRH